MMLPTSNGLLSVLLFCSCHSILNSIASGKDTLSLHPTNRTTFDEVVKNITVIHESDKRFAKIETDQIEIYRDNYCYTKQTNCGKDGCNSYDRLIGVCLRLRLLLVNDTSFYMFVRDNGIYYNNESSGNYTRVEGVSRGSVWYEDYIKEQLELRGRTYICPGGEEPLPEIFIDGTKLEKASSDLLDGCSEVCLSRATLRGLHHIRLSQFKMSVVLCFAVSDDDAVGEKQEICASPFHVIRGKDGKAMTMQELCRDRRLQCELRHEQVSKALLFTQSRGGYGVTFVASRSRWMRSLLLVAQSLLDSVVYIVLNPLFSIILLGLCMQWISNKQCRLRKRLLTFCKNKEQFFAHVH